MMWRPSLFKSMVSTVKRFAPADNRTCEAFVRALPWRQVSGDEGRLSRHGAHLLQIFILHHVCGQTLQKLLLILLFLCHKRQTTLSSASWDTKSTSINATENSLKSVFMQQMIKFVLIDRTCDTWCWYEVMNSAAYEHMNDTNVLRLYMKTSNKYSLSVKTEETGDIRETGAENVLSIIDRSTNRQLSCAA